MTQRYDLVIIGGGPAGYTAAVRAARLGMKTACIERSSRLGGVCLNVGCIPSKALLDSSEIFELARLRMKTHGVLVQEIQLDLAEAMKRKEAVVNELTGQVRRLLENSRVDIVQGDARLISANHVEVTTESGETSLEAGFVLLAMGSRPIELPQFPIDGKTVVDSTGALSFDAVPKRLAIIGAGAIGLELGSVWRRYGTEVTVIEMLPQIVPNLDGQISRTLKRILSKQGMQFLLKTKVLSADIRPEEVTLHLDEEGRTTSLTVDKVLVAVGRIPNTDGLGLSELGVQIDPKTRRIVVDSRLQTSVKGVYAAGDLVPGPMLAHKAMAEGIAAVEAMAGADPDLPDELIPSVVYTNPEVASVGHSEEWLKSQGIPYITGVFPYGGNGRAWCAGETDGLAKVIAHAQTDRLLGIHLIGPRASDIIAECIMAMRMGVSAEELASTVHAHPTFAEALMEAAGIVGTARKAKAKPKS